MNTKESYSADKSGVYKDSKGNIIGSFQDLMNK